jgi:hypothetical protein
MSNGLSNTRYDLTNFFELMYVYKTHGAHRYNMEPQRRLGKLMKQLYELLGNRTEPHAIEIDACLFKIRKYRRSKESLETWRRYLSQYLEIKRQRDEFVIENNLAKSNTRFFKRSFKRSLDPVSDIDKKYDDYWGSDEQLKFGCIVISSLDDMRDMDPVFGSLLYPIGGFSKILLNKKEKYGAESVILHNITHDAAGYLYRYHAVGPGYNYIRSSFTCFPTSSPKSNNMVGLIFWSTHIQTFKYKKTLYGLDTVSHDDDSETDESIFKEFDESTD